MTRREEFTAWICAQTGSAYVWGAQGHKVRRDGTVYMHQRKVSDSYESWVRCGATERYICISAR